MSVKAEDRLNEEHLLLRESIVIKGARTNNLRNVDITIPKNQLVVITGVSGSGKSSITIDTLYAEGQRRYVESLSSYARQFLNRMKKPDVDYIKGICPAIAIEQKVSSGNNRSTVGSMTETYDYLRLLYARIGKTYSPVSGELVRKHEVSDVVDWIQSQPKGARIQLFVPLPQKYGHRTVIQELQLLMQKGYSRVRLNGEIQQMEDLLATENLETPISDYTGPEILVLIDRFVVDKDNEENRKRIADSVQTAFNESEGECLVEGPKGETVPFNNRFEMDGIVFLQPSPYLFNYNNPFGACPVCEGYGKTMGIDELRVIPDQSKSVYEGAIACWNGEKGSEWIKAFKKNAHQFDFPIHRAYADLTDAEREVLWTGNEYFQGITAYFNELETQTYKIQNRVILSRFRGKTTCYNCKGGRLRKEAFYVKIGGKAITELTQKPIEELVTHFEQLKLSDYDRSVSKRILLEIATRLRLMQHIGLGYLTLERISSTLSGGETQRINLTRSLGSNLTHSMYILDEPSIGLHPRDTLKLLEVLRELRDLGNTVVVVEHEEEIIRHADYLIDMGPAAGIHGGEVVFAGKPKDALKADKRSLTAAYLTGKMEVPLPANRRQIINRIELKGARHNNLKNISVTIPVHALTVVTGVSGSGKSTLVRDILYPAIEKHLDPSAREVPGTFESLKGDLHAITQIEKVDQNPVGKSSRSNPVTYVKAYDAIRELFTSQQLSKIRGFKPKHFSFNVEGGRCETCKGEGEITIEMQFLADVRLTCEECNGQRFKKEVLEVLYKDKSIFDVLNLSVEEGLEFFKGEKEIIQKIRPLNDVGLGYVKLGQSSSTLSGGEAQRLKLAAFLTVENPNEKIFFLFDEPTTGLHFHDVRKLLEALNALVEKGHTVLVVEHNMDVIKCADWIIDLGPDGGKAGGNLVFEGRPEDLIHVKESYTGQFLKEKLKG
ncbi:MAG: excinuclease ABC subunit UvrA [Saprospiraceae bacterium]